MDKEFTIQTFLFSKDKKYSDYRKEKKMRIGKELYMKPMLPFRREIITRYTRMKAYDEMLAKMKERVKVYVK